MVSLLDLVYDGCNRWRENHLFQSPTPKHTSPIVSLLDLVYNTGVIGGEKITCSIPPDTKTHERRIDRNESSVEYMQNPRLYIHSMRDIQYQRSSFVDEFSLQEILMMRSLARSQRGIETPSFFDR
jgi:hypothetical protein